MLRHHRVARIRKSRAYRAAAKWFGRAPFAFMVFFNVVHIPVVVYGAYLMRSIELGAIAKAGVVAAAVVPACFILAFALRSVPGVKRIL